MIEDNQELNEARKVLEQFFTYQLSQEEKEAMIVLRTSDKTSKAIRGLLSKINNG